MTTVHGTMLKLKTEELATWTPFQITPFICSCLFSLETSTVETRCLNLLMLSLAAQSPRLVKDSFLEDRQHPGNTGTDNQSSKCVGAENWPVLGIGEWRVTFGKVNVFLHSSLELQPKRSDHFLHKISCYTFLRADDKQAAEYGLGRMPTRSSCLWCFITLAKGRERRATVAAGLLQNTGEQGEHGIQTWVFSIQQLVVFVLTLGACGQQPVRRVFETHWGILCFYLFSTEGERFWTIEIQSNFGVSVRSWPEPNLESYYVTMNALGRESARSADVPVTSTEGWQSALELLEELPERRLEATIRRLGEKSMNRERTWKGLLQHRKLRW